MPIIGVDRGGQHDQIGIPHSVFGIDDVAIDRAQLNRGFQVFDTPPNPDYPCRQPLSAENHAERSADQADSDNRDLSEV
jgi:hypothetical protein